MKNMIKLHRTIVIIILLILLIIFFVLGIISIKKYSSQQKPTKKDETIEVDKEVTFKNYTYKLPNGWNHFDDKDSKALIINHMGYIDGDLVQLSATIDVQELSSIEYDGDNLFKDVSFFEENLKNNSSFKNVGKGKLIQYGDYPVILVPCLNDKSSKFIMAYMPAYDDYFYYVYFYSSKNVNDEWEEYYNYDNILVVIDFLNSRVKADN